MKKQNCFLYNQQVKDLAKKGEALFKDLPHLPKDWVKNIVKILPYLVIIGAIVSLLSGLQSVFAFNRNRAFLMHWTQVGRTYFYVSGGFSIALGILYFMAYEPVKNQEYDGWLLLFWASILSVAQSIVLLIFGWGNLFGPLIGAVFGFYLLYEIRPEYLTKAKEEIKKAKDKVK